MRKLLVIAAIGLFSPLVHAEATDYVTVRETLQLAEDHLNGVYWRVYNRLPVHEKRQLKADEIEWIRWKDSLDPYNRIGAVADRIAYLEGY